MPPWPGDGAFQPIVNFRRCGTGKPVRHTGPGLLSESVRTLPVPALGTIYISSQTCLSTLALSGPLALEASDCLPAEWSRCGPSSLPHHLTASEPPACLSAATASNLVPPLRVLMKLPVSTPLLSGYTGNQPHRSALTKKSAHLS